MDTQTSTAIPVYEPGIYSMHRLIGVCQWITWSVGAFFNFLIVRNHRRVIRLSDIEPGMRYVVAANHQTLLDPLMVPAQLHWNLWKKIGLPRTLLANRFFRYPILGTYVRSIGSFPARVHSTDPYGLDYAKYHLDHGRSVLIFPEGRLSRKRQHRAKNGIMVLAHQPNVRIIPIHIEWRRNKLGLFVLDVGVGKPFDARQMLAEEILEYIYSIPVK